MKDVNTAPQQLELKLPHHDGQDDIKNFNSRLTYKEISSKHATFKAGLGSPVHRWFRLTPSFGPNLVRTMLHELDHDEKSAVLDPFSGAGTTPIECQLLQIGSFGIEVNPFLHFVGSTCLSWHLDIGSLMDSRDAVFEKLESERQLVAYEDLFKMGYPFPRIHNATRWWREDVLRDLILLKSIINRTVPDRSVRDFFRLALAGALVPDLTNVTLGRLQLHFIDRTEDEIDVTNVFASQVSMMMDDMQTLQQHEWSSNSRVFWEDTTQPQNICIDKPIRSIITSPPYPNRYSYVWNTRPHLYLLDFFGSPREAADLDKKTIGGTWGSATSSLSKGTVLPKIRNSTRRRRTSC